MAQDTARNGLKFEEEEWREFKYPEPSSPPSNQPIRHASLPSTCYMFIDRDAYPHPTNDHKNSQTVLDRTLESQSRETKRRDLLELYNVPRILLSDTSTDMNGYFGSHSSYDVEGKLLGHNTWLRCLVKIIWIETDRTPDKPAPEKEYAWYEMAFFTQWDETHHRVLCIETPKYFVKSLSRKTNPKPDQRDPFAMLRPLIDEVVEFYDKSVWRIARQIRDIEKVRSETRLDLFGFEKMQEILRHAIHVREALTVMIDNLHALQEDQDKIYKELKGHLWKNSQTHLRLQIQMVKALEQRSVSNVERLQSEITLAYNIIVQQDNKVMKSVAWLTIIFLPATFVSAFFSTSFFQFGNDGWGGIHNIWVYWVVTIPATVFVYLLFPFSMVSSSNASSLWEFWKAFLQRRLTSISQRKGRLPVDKR